MEFGGEMEERLHCFEIRLRHAALVRLLNVSVVCEMIVVAVLVQAFEMTGRHVNGIHASSILPSDANEGIDYIAQVTVHAYSKELANLGRSIGCKSEVVCLGEL